MDEKLLVIDATNVADHRGGWMGDGGFYVRPMRKRAGEIHPGHDHYIPHLGCLISGKAIVRWKDPDGSNGVIEMREAPCKIHMPANRHHEIEFLEDSEWECMFAKAEADRIYGESVNFDWTMERGAW